MADRLTSKQLEVLTLFERQPMILKPKVGFFCENEFERRTYASLEKRGYIKPHRHSLFQITEAGAKRIGFEVCKCGAATHPQEAACVHCGIMKDWAK